MRARNDRLACYPHHPSPTPNKNILAAKKFHRQPKSPLVPSSRVHCRLYIDPPIFGLTLRTPISVLLHVHHAAMTFVHRAAAVFSSTGRSRSDRRDGIFD